MAKIATDCWDKLAASFKAGAMDGGPGSGPQQGSGSGGSSGSGSSSGGSAGVSGGSHLHITATHESGAGKKFSANAGNTAGVEHHLSNLHAHIKQNNLGTHNVSIHNTNTGEIHQAKINPAQGVYKRSYGQGDLS